MHTSIAAVAAIMAILTFPACKSQPLESTEAITEAAAPQTSEQGAWLGTGKFQAANGTADIKAQLEILADGTYRFLVLEPRVMMLWGVEKGDWKTVTNAIYLTPYKDQKTTQTGVLGRVPKDFRPKTLTMPEDKSMLILKDGGMDMQFKPNPKAMKKLRDAGEVN